MTWTGKTRMLEACSGGRPDRPPVWLMRQAGRYLPEYLELRRQHSFWDVVRTPALALEVALQPLRRFPLDATIVFSDILVVLEAAGADVRFGDGGPKVHRPFEGPSHLEALQRVEVTDHMGFLGEAVSRLRDAVHPDKAVIGFAGAPLTLASYWVEGGSRKDLRGMKALHYRDPGGAQALLMGLAEVVADLLLMQIDAGADIVQVFDSWAGLLGPDDYRDLAAPALRRVQERLAPTGVPAILYVRGAASHLETAADLGFQVVSVDGSVRLDEARRRLGGAAALQGNMDPAELMGPEERIRGRVDELMSQAGPTGYIVNLGQGLVPEVPVEGVHAMVDQVVSHGRG